MPSSAPQPELRTRTQTNDIQRKKLSAGSCGRRRQSGAAGCPALRKTRLRSYSRPSRHGKRRRRDARQRMNHAFLILGQLGGLARLQPSPRSGQDAIALLQRCAQQIFEAHLEVSTASCWNNRSPCSMKFAPLGAGRPGAHAQSPACNHPVEDSPGSGRGGRLRPRRHRLKLRSLGKNCHPKSATERGSARGFIQGMPSGMPIRALIDCGFSRCESSAPCLRHPFP